MSAESASPMARDDLPTKRWSPFWVDLPVLPRESLSGKIQTRYFPPRREISETSNSCSCSCRSSCSNLSHSWCMGEQLSYIHCWGVPQGSQSRPPASTGTLRYTPPVNVGNCPYLKRQEKCKEKNKVRITRAVSKVQENFDFLFRFQKTR